MSEVQDTQEENSWGKMLDINIKMTEYCILQVVSALRFEIFKIENTFKNTYFVEESLMVRLKNLW